MMGNQMQKCRPNVENEPKSHQIVQSSSNPPPPEMPKATDAEQVSPPHFMTTPPPIQYDAKHSVRENLINNKVEASALPTLTDRLTTGPNREEDPSPDKDAGAVISISPSRHSSKNDGVPSDSRLSLYLYPKRNRGNKARTDEGISPIFDLLQNQSTLETARTLLKFEGEMWERKKELRILEKKKEAIQSTLQDEHKLDATYANVLKELHKNRRGLEKAMGSWNPLLGWWDKDSDDEDDGRKEPDGDKNDDDGDEEGNEDDDDEAEDGEKSGSVDDDGGEKKSGNGEEGMSDLTLFERRRIARKKARMETNRKERSKMSRRAKGIRMNAVIEDIKKHEKWKKETNDRIASLNLRITQWNQAIDSKSLLIEELRAKFAVIKGEGSQEDEHFHMDNSRDENGHTFLMVAAQNNDFDTAQLCLNLQADPNARSAEGHTAMVFAYYFGFDTIVTLIARNGGIYPAKLTDSWNSIEKSMMRTWGENPVDWDIMHRIAEQAAIPTESVLASAEALEKSEESRMAILPREERTRPTSFFDASLFDPTKHVLRRVILLDESAYNWYFGTTKSEKLAFVAFLDSLNRRETFQCHRRAVVGLKNPYEINCAALDSKPASLVTLFTPFVASVVDGVCDVGIIVWAVTTDDKASLFKTLIESTEFLRHKEDRDELFPQCLDGVLKLGADMDLLDLKSTNILTSKPMDLYILSIDDGDLQLLKEDKYAPRKRITHFERYLRTAVFHHASKAEAEDGLKILSTEQHYGMSTTLQGGAGTGKTLLMIKKVISEPLEKRILVVARLPRLVSEIRRAVSAERDVKNVTFSTYNDLLALLARKVKPADEAEHRYFSSLTQIHFGETTGIGLSSSVSFVEGFIQNCLEENERRAMRANNIEPITLWTAFRDIKSNAKCSLSKCPLLRQEYMSLSPSFGLRSEQRELVYDLYIRYEEWRQSGSKWDEADRLLYVMAFGPPPFSSPEFVSWEERAYKRGEIELLEEEADGDSPLAPFFYHMVFADEAQDLTELDLALFLRMGGLGSLFLGADPAQSVETGVRMRGGTINDVFHASLPVGRKGEMTQVKNVLQEIQMRRNHRTHAQNLAIANAVRRMMARSFGVTTSNEVALVTGPIPELLSVSKIDDLADTRTFKGGNIVFLVPDEMLEKVRNEFCRHNTSSDERCRQISNDVFGVREVKGLEFESVALLGFFSYIDHLGSAKEWENSLRWLASNTGITTTASSEKILGRQLENCDYRLSHPEVLDQVMMLYTALTRVREKLYIIEVAEYGKKQKGANLGDTAFRHLLELDLAKSVKSIDAGKVEMTPQQHKVRGALMVRQAIALARDRASTVKVKETFRLAADRFRPDTGNEKDLLEQCEKHC